MNKKQCQELLKMANKCSCKGEYVIVSEIHMNGDKYFYLECNKCGETFEG